MILWCGGEDIDFLSAPAVSVSLTAAAFRAAYARCGVYQNGMNTIAASNPFPAGPFTSAWLSARVYGANNFGSASYPTQRAIGFGLSGTSKGLFVGSASGSNNGNKLALCKYDGTTTTQLAAEGGASLAPTTQYCLNIQVVNFGVAATVNVYLNGALLIAYTGDVTVSGMTSFDSVLLARITDGYLITSEIIVADEDTRGMSGLVTLALNGSGSTDAWTGAYGTTNQTTISDTTPNYTATAAQDQQFNVTDPPSGIFDVKAVKIAARAAKSGTPTKIALGYNSGGTVGVGAAKALTMAYATYESLDLVNPVTGVAFTVAEITALQLNARSAA